MTHNRSQLLGGKRHEFICFFSRKFNIQRLIAVFAFLLACTMLVAQIYEQPYRLYEIKTRYFTIIFPEASKKSVQYLSTFADAVYEEVAKKLDTSPSLAIPVLITPDCEAINGFFATYPIVKIVLYETSISKNTSLSFNNELYKLFYHELTHFVSLTALNPLMQSFYKIFGGWIYIITQIQIPFNFIEGVTVSFESHDGWGRAVDPLVGGQIRQDILENNFKTFVQSMGAWDKYPRYNNFYWYGGYFSLYLQNKYGLERYAELWRYFSNPVNIKPLDDIGFIKGKFREIYGITLDTAWEDFKDYMSIKTPVYMHIKKLSQEANYTVLETDGSNVFVYDPYKNAVQALNPVQGSIQTILTHSQTVERISQHRETGALLLSTYSGSSVFPKQVLEVYARGKLTALPWKKMSDAVWAGNNILAIETDNYARNLVLLTGNEKKTILKGNESVIYWNPVSNESGTVFYVLAAEEGNTSIVRILMDNDSIIKVQKLKLNEQLTWLRYLSYANGRLLASWDDNKLYRLVEIADNGTAESVQIVYQTVPITGGVHYPVVTNAGIVYLGFFSQGKQVCMFPDNRTALGCIEESSRWEDASHLMTVTSAFDADEPVFPITKYNSARWLLPSNFIPIFWYDSSNDIFKGEATLIFSDPTETWYSELYAGWKSSTPETVEARLLTQLMLYPIILQASVQDFFYGRSDDISRQSSAVLALQGVFGNNDTFSAILAGRVAGYSEFTQTSHDYYRFWDLINTGFSFQLSYTDTRAIFNEPSKYEGVSLHALYRLDRFIIPDYPVYYTGLEGRINLAYGNPFIELVSEGAWSPNETLYYGPAGLAYMFNDKVYPEISTLTVYPELAMHGFAGYSVWYIQNSLSLRLVTAELQRSFLALYFNRLFINAGCRAAFSATPVWILGETPLSQNFSAFASLNITGGTGFFALAAAHFTIGLEIAMAWNNVLGFRMLITASM